MVYGRTNRNRRSGPSLAIHNAGSTPGGGTKIPHAARHDQKRKKNNKIKQKKQGITPVLKELFTRGKGHIQKQVPEVLGVKIGEGRERDGEGNGTPLQYSCLENPMGRAAWQAAVHGVAKSQTCPLQYSCLEIAWTEEPDELPSLGSQKSWTRLSN